MATAHQQQQQQPPPQHHHLHLQAARGRDAQRRLPTTASRSPSLSPSQLPPVPSSPAYSMASTTRAGSQFMLPLPPAPRPVHAVLTKVDLEHSTEAYGDLVVSAKAYRLALASLSSAASAFASALEACARLKESRAEPMGSGACTADPLLSASGVHHLVANHHQILSETVYRSFELPLLHDLDKWHSVIDDEEHTYQHKIRAQGREVKRLEKEGLKLHKQRRRDVARFRAHLVDLTTKLDGLTTLHADHAHSLLLESQETSARIVNASCSLVRAEVDIFESLSRKGWAGGGLDDLLDRGQDLFAADDVSAEAASTPSNTSATLFSILPPKSILADSASAHEPDRSGGLLPPAPAPADADGDDADDDAAGGTESLFAASTLPATASTSGSSTHSARSSDITSTVTAAADTKRPSRSARSFSPQPIRRIPTDITFDSLGALAAIAVSAAHQPLQPLLDDIRDDMNKAKEKRKKITKSQKGSSVPRPKRTQPDIQDTDHPYPIAAASARNRRGRTVVLQPRAWPRPRRTRRTCMRRRDGATRSPHCDIPST